MIFDCPQCQQGFVGPGAEICCGCMQPEFAIVESMTEIQVPGHRIRVWRKEAELQESYDNEDLHLCAQSMRHNKNVEIIRALRKCERVTAIEIVNGGGAGSVAYTEW